jgi:hypothetical protein
MKTTMKVSIISAALLLGCAGPQKTASRPGGETGGSMGASAAAAAVAVPALDFGSRAEPLGCPFLAGEAKPEQAIQELGCITEWMKQSRDYLAGGGSPTKYTDQKHFEEYQGEAKRRIAGLSKWIEDARFESTRAVAKAVLASGGSATSSQQHYLDGLISFQKGDYDKARQDWVLAKQLDPANTDAQTGLELLDKRYPAGANPPD